MPLRITSESIGITTLLDSEQFKIPIIQESDQHFPEYLECVINKYLFYFDNQLHDQINEIRQGDEGSKTQVTNIVHAIAEGIIKTVQYYYEGKILKATTIFNSMMDGIEFEKLSIVDNIKAERNFYRARRSESGRFKREDLFHNPFEKRSFVSTSRYSVPGLPALYLGGSIYVCWEEFDRPPIQELYFSRFNNTTTLKVIKIQRFDDFFKDLPLIEDNIDYGQEEFILRYISTFPLLIACSIKTRQPKGPFKPEYIIPQLLLQYVAGTEEIDGILFPSTKVNYGNIDNVSAYNYVFPVRHIAKEGFCTALLEKFRLTEPTSLELEALIHYSEIKVRQEGYVNPLPGNLTIVEGVSSPYIRTAFGRIEETLIERILASPID